MTIQQRGYHDRLFRAQKGTPGQIIEGAEGHQDRGYGDSGDSKTENIEQDGKAEAAREVHFTDLNQGLHKLLNRQIQRICNLIWAVQLPRAHPFYIFSTWR